MTCNALYPTLAVARSYAENVNNIKRNLRAPTQLPEQHRTGRVYERIKSFDFFSLNSNDAGWIIDIEGLKQLNNTSIFYSSHDICLGLLYIT